MAKGKDFFGKDVTEAIRQACRELAIPQEELDIEVLETGSAGIFGLCRKKAHIRVTPKAKADEGPAEKPGRRKGRPAAEKKSAAPERKRAESPSREVPKQVQQEQPVPAAEEGTAGKESAPAGGAPPEQQGPSEQPASEVEREPPSAEILETIQADLEQLLDLMGYPSRVAVEVEGITVHCRISGEHEEAIIGSDGRTLDSLQYLLRKMMSRRLPDRVMLTLDAGNFRQRRAEELKERARDLAGQVREDGKTRAIPALNPSERRVVHMTLQEDKGIRSRSVGDGLFKKVLIYRPGKDKKAGSRKRRGRQGDRSSSGN